MWLPPGRRGPGHCRRGPPGMQPARSGPLSPPFHTPHFSGLGPSTRGSERGAGQLRCRRDATSRCAVCMLPAAGRGTGSKQLVAGGLPQDASEALRLSVANNRFRGGFCPQRHLSVEGALGILNAGLKGTGSLEGAAGHTEAKGARQLQPRLTQQSSLPDAPL